MAKDTTVGVRVDDLAVERLDALTVKLGLSRSGVLMLALARLAEAEGVAQGKGELVGSARR